MVFEKSPFHVHGGPRINFTSNFRWIFDAFLLQKLFETRSEKTFDEIIDFSSILGRFWGRFWLPKSKNSDSNSRLVVLRGPGTPWERILTLPGGLFETPGGHLGTPWGPSGTIPGGLAGFLDHLGLMLGSK